MNAILLFPSDFVSSDVVCLTGRRFAHIMDILKPSVGDVLTVGLVNDLMGKGVVKEITQNSLTLETVLNQEPPKALPIILCMALMRPIVFKRVLLTAASLGIKEIIFFHSNKVEKSFWQSTSLQDQEIALQLMLGLEQAKDTQIPHVSFQKKFKPFVEDVLMPLSKDYDVIVADPSGKALHEIIKESSFPKNVLVLGPEGGFTTHEIEMFKKAGCQLVGLGERILKVETAMVALISQWFCLKEQK